MACVPNDDGAHTSNRQQTKLQSQVQSILGKHDSDGEISKKIAKILTDDQVSFHDLIKKYCEKELGTYVYSWNVSFMVRLSMISAILNLKKGMCFCQFLLLPLFLLWIKVTIDWIYTVYKTRV